jgi:signal peptidase II
MFQATLANSWYRRAPISALPNEAECSSAHITDDARCAPSANVMSHFIFLFSAIFVFAADQGIKALMLGRGRDVLKLFGSAAIRVVLNPNGRQRISSRPLLVGFWVTEVTILSLLSQYQPWLHHQQAQAAFGILLGGVTANLADRLWRGGIVDYVDLRIWPIFNIADVAIVAGALAVVLSAAV